MAIVLAEIQHQDAIRSGRNRQPCDMLRKVEGIGLASSMVCTVTGIIEQITVVCSKVAGESYVLGTKLQARRILAFMASIGDRT